MNITALDFTILPASLPDGKLGKPYSQKIYADGGKAPFTFTVIAGSLPDGLSLVPASDNSFVTLQGIPTKVEDCPFTLDVIDSNNAEGIASY